MKMKKYFSYGIFSLFIIDWIYSGYHALRGVNFEFNGIVQKVTYTPGQIQPIISVKNQQYDLECVRWYDDLYKVEVGDSVIKHKGDQWMTLIKKNKKSLQ